MVAALVEYTSTGIQQLEHHVRSVLGHILTLDRLEDSSVNDCKLLSAKVLHLTVALLKLDRGKTPSRVRINVKTIQTTFKTIIV